MLQICHAKQERGTGLTEVSHVQPGTVFEARACPDAVQLAQRAADDLQGVEVEVREPGAYRVEVGMVPRHLEVLGRLARQARGYRLLGRVPRIPKLVVQKIIQDLGSYHLIEGPVIPTFQSPSVARITRFVPPLMKFSAAS